MRIVSRYFVCIACAVTLMAGCSKSVSPGNTSVGGTAAQSTFPVYSPSTVASVGRYDDSSEITQMGQSFFSGQNGQTDYAYPYIGSQELIRTNATLDQLEAWIHKLAQAPPQGLVRNEGAIELTQNNGSASTSSSDSPLAQPLTKAFNALGLLPVEFWSSDHKHVVMLVIFEPKLVAAHLGPGLDALDQYQKVPAFLRSGIDAAMRKNIGVGASDLIDTNTPAGLIVSATRNWKDQDTRAIVLIDANRQPNPLPTPRHT